MFTSFTFHAPCSVNVVMYGVIPFTGVVPAIARLRTDIGKPHIGKYCFPFAQAIYHAGARRSSDKGND